MANDEPQQPLPQSLGNHVIPTERAEMIREHVAMLSRTALAVSDRLPFSADASDLHRVLDANAEK